MFGLLLTLLAEGLLLLIVLGFGSSLAQRETKKSAIAVLDLKGATRRNPAPGPIEVAVPALRPANSSPSKTDRPEKAELQPEEPQPKQQAQQLIQLSRSEMAAIDIAAMPRQAQPVVGNGQSKMGPPDTGVAVHDTARVGGSGPNGEALYAAAWYREPYDDELRGYLSTATGPGWALIACRTAPDYRVEDCEKIDEYPNGSNIARAILAAAWQFQVRPPRLGGQPKIGEWVRIRIDYDYRHK